ncbi:tyrosine-type recombinase/integrase [Pseudomaricurvus alkylphenolicus]|uniref:tyrosine-type recombinase/integrase n=1 Tax=Pseudomaricurvus alkylphenolicus TaxID=1306991 RepID=UPI001F0FBF90|nr:tyrosine-type recombinase/integrase [Pseudomaricurvus alkylphenolicus]
MKDDSVTAVARKPWNKGKIVGQKPPLKQQDVWAIRIRLQMSNQVRELAMFNLAIDSKLRSCDLLALRVQDVTRGGHVLKRAMIIQQKTHHPVQFELTSQTREAVGKWIQHAGLAESDYLFPSRIKCRPHLSTRQYARIVDSWFTAIGLDPSEYGTHSLRRTKAALIYRRTKIFEWYSCC